MIKIDLIAAVAFYFSAWVSLVIGHWIFYNFSKEKDEFDTAVFFECCPYCTYIFFDYKKDGARVCPRCRSYTTEREDR